MTTTKSPEACFSPYTYAVPKPSFPGRVRSTCRIKLHHLSCAMPHICLIGKQWQRVAPPPVWSPPTLEIWSQT